ncbi:MAG: GNAT family N-acetyltransferase [Mycobacteriales bacterium]
MQPVEIAAGRVQLVPFSAQDEDEVLAACQDPAIQHWTTVPSPYTRELAHEWLTRDWFGMEQPTWAVREATTGRLLANITLRVSDDVGDVGYWCTAEARGTGIMTEALQAVCRWGFGALDLDHITWCAEVGNWASRAVAEKSGFRVEGTRRRLLKHRGQWVDGWVGTLLSTDPITDVRPLPSRLDLTDGVVRLRRWRAEDAADVARACDDALTAEWLPVPSPYTLEHGRSYVEEHTSGAWADGTAAETAVVDAVSGELLGAMGLKLHNRHHGFGEIGYWTAPWARGRGVASRGAALLAGWGLQALGLHRVELLAEVTNARSIRVAERAGFNREGLLRWARLDREGSPVDMVVFSRVR